jgi:hypothetical protein
MLSISPTARTPCGASGIGTWLSGRSRRSRRCRANSGPGRSTSRSQISRPPNASPRWDCRRQLQGAAHGLVANKLVSVFMKKGGLDSWHRAQPCRQEESFASSVTKTAFQGSNPPRRLAWSPSPLRLRLACGPNVDPIPFHYWSPSDAPGPDQRRCLTTRSDTEAAAFTRARLGNRCPTGIRTRPRRTRCLRS